jgi:predicted amidophosphoribosyltransferase
MCNLERSYDRNVAIANREGILQSRMNDYKFRGLRGWRLIFARILLGYLDANVFEFAGYDLIVASPAYVGPRSHDDSVRLILLTAAQIDKYGWPFDTSLPPVIVRTRAVTSMKKKKWKEREGIAQTELRGALSIPNLTRTRGKRILVFDDLYTTGHTLNEVARCLVSIGGASTVTGISLARQLHQP